MQSIQPGTAHIILYTRGKTAKNNGGPTNDILRIDQLSQRPARRCRGLVRSKANGAIAAKITFERSVMPGGTSPAGVRCRAALCPPEQQGKAAGLWLQWTSWAARSLSIVCP